MSAPTREVEVHGNKVFVVENGIEIAQFLVNAQITEDEALRHAEMFKASGDMLAALTALLAILGGDRSPMPECVAARDAIARARGETP